MPSDATCIYVYIYMLLCIARARFNLSRYIEVTIINNFVRVRRNENNRAIVMKTFGLIKIFAVVITLYMVNDNYASHAVYLTYLTSFMQP